MKTARLLLAACACLVPGFAGYTYDYTNLLNPYNSAWWANNGTGNTISTNFYTNSSANGGALIFNSGTPLPAPSYNYEVKTTLKLPVSGGTYVTYLRATSNSMLVSGNMGVFYGVELASPTYVSGVCSAMLTFGKQSGGTAFQPLYSSAVSCHDGMVLRVVFNQGNGIVVYIDNSFASSWYDQGTIIATGQPGVGVIAAPTGNGISDIAIGHLDTVPPNPITSQMVGTSSFPTHVDIQIEGVTDDANGTGVAYYQFYKNGSWLTFTSTPEMEDRTVAAGTAYVYLLQAIDYHGNISQTSINVTTPPAGAIDPREVGVRPTGTYFGAGGEQIDMRSGNLNFTIPLFKAMSRGGGGAGFNLSYNSQNWRQDPGGTWQFGRDIGYGYGWRLQAGSLTPVYRDYWTLDHYLFIDSTGAEYRLDVNTSGVWSSKESIYVYYDSNAGRLYFTDGSFWTFGCLSGGGEEDAGTLYPTSMYDSNGNYIGISYNNGVGLPTNNSSSRIFAVADVRGAGGNVYTFTYNHDTPPHLTGVTNSVGTAEKYTLSYATNTLTSPFTPPTGYGTWTFLASVANNIPLTTSFTYSSAGSGELTQVTFPYLGHLRWGYGPSSYSGTRTLREVNAGRFLSTASGAPETTYAPWYSGDPSLTFHSYSGLNDPDGLSQKAWSFGTDNTKASYGLMSYLEKRPHQSGSTAGETAVSPTWTTDTAGNPYMSAVYTIEDNFNPTAIAKQTSQTIDQYGNVTQMLVYGYGAPGSNLPLLRTYTNTYLNTSAYTSRYIFNRLLLSKVSDGTNSTTLASNTYDCCTLTDAPGIQNHYSLYNTTFLSRGNVTTSVTPAGTRILGYDIAGNLLLHNNNGLTTNSTVNGTTNFVAPSLITTISLSSSMSYSAAMGVTSASGPNGDSLTILYDTNNRPQTTTSPLGAQTTFTYNDNPSPPAPPTKVATTNGHWVKTSMDGLGRTIKSETGNGTTTLSVVDTVYVPCGCSPLGKMGQQSAPHDPNGTVYWTTYSYDGLGRTTQVQLPDGSITHYAYSGNQVTVTDPANKYKNFFTDALGNLYQVQEPDPTLGLVSTNYTYDILNHLISVSMPRGSNTQTRTFNYNVGATVGIDLLTATNPENGMITYTYNSDHTLASKGSLTYLYDSYKRLTKVYAGGNLLRTFIYDTNSLDSMFSGTYTAGRLVAVQHTAFTPQGYQAGVGGSNITVPSSMQFVEMYNYKQSGLVLTKRLQVEETLHYYINGVLHDTPQTLNLDGAYTYDTGGEGKMKSVNYPTTYSYNGTNLVSNTGPTYTYSFDAMDRPIGLTDQNSNTIVNNVTYNPANQLLTFNSETRTYNNLNQMTRLTVTGNLDISYNFPAGTNNGKISSQTDNLSVETVTYQYDSLNRLLSASSTQSWSETYGFDGFGNLLSKTGTGGAPTLSQAVDAATNHIVGQNYDSKGNQLSGPLGTVAYDAENRIASMSAGGVQYTYDSRNKRIWKSILSAGNLAQEVYFYGVDGQKIGTYTFTLALYNNVNPEMTDNTGIKLAVFFGAKRIGTFDRLGTAKFNANGQPQSFYPYGEDRGTIQPNDSLKFATYTRDTATGLDYADQRYYASNFGRFMSADRYVASGGKADPQSWNRYSYVAGDPLNFNDPSGQFRLYPMIEDPFGGNDGSESGGGGGCGPGWETDASLSGPCCPSGDSFAPGDPSPSPFCPAPPPPDPTPAPKKPRGFWSLVVTKDCYDVPTNGGPVTREVDYQLMFWAPGYAAPMFSNQGVIWEHLTGDIPPAGADSPSSGAPGTYDDTLSVLLGPRVQRVNQRFSAVLSDGTDVGLFVAKFGAFPDQDIVKYFGYVSINGNIGGKVDKNGRLIPGTYTPCP